MLKFNNKVLNINGNWLNAGLSPVPPGPEPISEVTIGTQTWMAKGLSIDDGEGGIILKENVTNNTINFGNQYYYTPEAAIRVASNVEGWHLPTSNELNTFKSYLSNMAYPLKSTQGWNMYYQPGGGMPMDGNGTDDYGFTAYPIGYLNSSGNLVNVGNCIYLLSISDRSPYYIGAYFDTSPNFVNKSDLNTNCYYSVRLIKDT